MFKYVYSAVVSGGKDILVRIECDIRDGLPSFTMVGFVSSNVREAGERVQSALYNSGFALKPKRILINLSPADVKKDGTSYDLPIAMSILASLMEVPDEILKTTAFSGELSLDGRLRPEGGCLPRVIAAKNAGLKRFVLPLENVPECGAVEGIEVIGVSNLEEAGLLLVSGFKDVPAYNKEIEQAGISENEEALDMSDIRGQESAKRAALIAACGMHNLALIGSAGSGKSMIAKRIPGILPPLLPYESLEVSRIYSLSGLLPPGSGIMKKRPFRNPNHTVGLSAFFGGSKSPGEIALANRGVLFLDEFPEFKAECIEALREPLEDMKIKVSTKEGPMDFPAKSLTVITANPCSCGFYPDRRRCRCTEAQVKKYLGKISRPIWDRFDLVAVTEEVGFDTLKGAGKTSSADMKKIVEKTWDIQRKRFINEGITFNSEMDMDHINKFCALREKETELLERGIEADLFSGRGKMRVLQVARTIADMEGAEDIGIAHISESISYRAAISGFIN